MSTVVDVERAIERMSPEELREFRAWFAERDAAEWDRQFEGDVAAGKLDALADEALEDLRAGRSTDLAAKAPLAARKEYFMADDRITVWRLIAHHAVPDDALRWSAQTNRIAMGWGGIGSIEAGRYASARDISDAIRDADPDLPNRGSGGVCLYDFCFRMEIGDLVIVSGNGRRSLVMEVEGDYEFKPDPEPEPIGYQHQRKATSLPIDPDELWRQSGGGPRDGHNSRWTLIECSNPIDRTTKEKLTHAASRRPAS